MNKNQYNKIRKFAEERGLNLEEYNARRYAEVKAYLYLTRDNEHRSIEDAQNYYWAQKKFKFFKFTKGFGLTYSKRADEIIRLIAR